jgi:hypothetical protein
LSLFKRRFTAKVFISRVLAAALALGANLYPLLPQSAEASHLRGGIVTAEYHADHDELHISSTMLAAKASPASFGTPTITYRTTPTGTPTAAGCTVVSDSANNVSDDSNPLFAIRVTAFKATGCFNKSGYFVISASSGARIGGIINASNSNVQYETQIYIGPTVTVASPVGAAKGVGETFVDSTAPVYNSGYMYNILYSAAATGAEIDYSTNLNALSGSTPISNYSLITDISSAAGAFGAARIPCSALNTSTGVFSIRAANCQAGESLSTMKPNSPSIYALKVRATDSLGQFTTRDVLLSIDSSANKKPVFASQTVTPTQSTAGTISLNPAANESATVTLVATDDDSGDTLDFTYSPVRSWITKGSVTQSIVNGKKQASVTYTISPPSGTHEIIQAEFSVFDNQAFSLSSSVNYNIEAGVVLAAGVPGKPVISQINGTTVTATFDAPGSGGSVDSYQVVATPDTGSSISVNGCVPATPCAITGLTSHMPYSVTVSATNAGGTTTSPATEFNAFYPLTTANQTTSFSASNLILGGDASISGSEITLTPNAGNKAGAVWGKNRVSMSDDFVIDSKINLGSSDAGADGLAFVLQPRSTSALTSGGGLGYGGMSAPMFAVEFDTYNNQGQEGADDHIALMKDGSSTEHSNFGTSLAAVANLEDGNWRNFRFSYRAPSGANPAKISVEVDLDRDGDYGDTGEIVFDNITADLETLFGGSSEKIYWGFTAATGGATNLQKVQIDRISSTSRANSEPEISVATASPIAVPAGSSRTINLTLSDDDSTAAQWRVSASSSDGRITVPASATISSATAATLVLTAPQNATAGTSTITLIAYDADGATKTITFVATVGVLPDAPTGLVAVPGSSKFTLTWTAPSNAVSSGLTDYVIEYSSNNGSTWSTYTDGVSTTTTVDVTSLQTNTNYVFRVAAKNSTGNGAYSNASAKTKIGVVPTSMPNRAPVTTFTPANTSTRTTAENAMLQAKMLEPQANAPAVEVVKDVSAAANSSEKRILESAVIPVGAQAKAAIKVSASDALNRVAAGFIRIGASNWFYLGNKDLEQDGTASTDMIAFAAPTAPGSEYVLVVAVVDSTFNDSTVAGLASVRPATMRLASVLGNRGGSNFVDGNSYVRRTAVSNTNINNIGIAQIQLSVEVTGTAIPVASSSSGSGSSPAVSPSPSASPSPSVSPKPTPKPSSSSGSGSSSGNGSNGSSSGGSAAGGNSGGSANNGGGSASGSGLTDNAGSGSGDSNGDGAAGDGTNGSPTSEPNASDPVVQATVQALPWALVVGGAALLWFMFFLSRRRRKSNK